MSKKEMHKKKKRSIRSGGGGPHAPSVGEKESQSNMDERWPCEEIREQIAGEGGKKKPI